MKFNRAVIFLALAMWSLPGLAAGEADPLFQSQDEIYVELTAPVAILLTERPEEEYLEGKFMFRQADGTWVNLDVKVRSRGNTRFRICDVPPLTLNFKKSQVEGTTLANQDKLKMVTHCKDSSPYQQSVLREYLAYRLLNLVTDQSFRVRLLKVAWEDSDGRRSRLVRYGFVIEHKDRMAARLGIEPLDVEYADIESVDGDHLNLTSLFQYLIGNVDFSPVVGSNNECCHNHEMYIDDEQRVIPIPYDFDLSGFADAPYAMPDREMGVEKVGQRVYRGYCGNNERVAASVDRFLAVRDAIYAEIDNLEPLDEGQREEVRAYVDEFYEIIEDPEQVQLMLIDQCTTDL